MKIFSLFSGIGGFDLAFERAGHVIVGHSEIDKHADEIYSKHFNNKNYGDITTINTNELPDFDCLVGGFPCQAFSVAGRRLGFEDTRGTLIYEVIRILRDKRPSHFILENVKGLLSHDGGFTFETILGILAKTGYDIQWKVLNSKDFGVPQNRERVYIIGHIRGERRPEVFCIGSNQKQDTRNVGEDLSYTIDANYHKGTNTLAKGRRQLIQLVGGSQGNRVYSSEGISCTLASQAGGMGANTGLYQVSRQPLRLLNRNQKNFDGEYSFTVDTTNIGVVRIKDEIRRLTPIECERLQGFPDNWTEGISDTQRYKALGNAVTVNVIEYISKNLHELGLIEVE